MNGKQGPQCNLVQNFCIKLNKEFNIPIVKWDERLSTRHTQSMIPLKKGQRIDHIVATTLLQEYLNFLTYSHNPEL